MGDTYIKPPLYRYRLDEDGTISCSVIKDYAIVEIRRRTEYRFRHKGPICSVREENLDKVKNWHLTSLTCTMEQARVLFQADLEARRTEALETAARMEKVLENMEACNDKT